MSALRSCVRRLEALLRWPGAVRTAPLTDFTRTDDISCSQCSDFTVSRCSRLPWLLQTPDLKHQTSRVNQHLNFWSSVGSPDEWTPPKSPKDKHETKKDEMRQEKTKQDGTSDKIGKSRWDKKRQEKTRKDKKRRDKKTTQKRRNNET